MPNAINGHVIKMHAIPIVIQIFSSYIVIFVYLHHEDLISQNIKKTHKLVPHKYFHKVV